MTKAARAACASLLAIALPAASQQPPAWMTEGPVAAGDDISIAVPIEVLARKLLVEVTVGGKPRRFVFDTGSPSMLDGKLADELGLAVVGRNSGRDAHGAVIETRIVQADFTVGGTTFERVPTFVVDFPKTARCLFDGVLGSELLPLCAWQIDLDHGVLRCESDLSRLSKVARDDRQALHQFGYPHTPILDVRFSPDAVSKAMFDTGSGDLFVLSPQDFEGTRRDGGSVGILAGYGSLGGSAGGMAPEREQRRVTLERLRIGPVDLGELSAAIRSSAPSLVGAALLEHFVVTLDARSGSAWLAPYGEQRAFQPPAHGFGMSFEGDVPTVSLVWEETPAHAAGLSAGQALEAINGRPATADCEGIRMAAGALAGAEPLDVTWEGGAVRLEAAPWPLKR